MKLFTKLLLVFMLFCLKSIISLQIPPSFHQEKKISSAENIAEINGIFKLLASFEIDTHIEVVLVGPEFTPKFVGHLTRGLDLLSTSLRYSSPDKFLHEKFIYHVNLGTIIASEVNSVLTKTVSDIIDPATIASILNSFHTRSATLTTLFILYFPEAMLEGYSYSTNVPLCSQRAFISNNGFAWLDLSADAATILPVDLEMDILPTTSYHLGAMHAIQRRASSGTINPNNATLGDIISSSIQLAADIHRSVEALSPYPTIHSVLTVDTNNNNNNNDAAKAVDANRIISQKVYVLVVITICADFTGSMKCQADAHTLSVARQIVDSYATAFTSIRLAEFELDFTSVCVSHAFHSAASYSSDWQSLRSQRIDSDILLLKLANCKEMIHGLAEVMDSIHDANGLTMHPDAMTMIPLIAFRYPENMDFYLNDDHQQTVLATFPRPYDGWITSDEEDDIGGEIASDGLQEDQVVSGMHGDEASLAERGIGWPEQAVLRLVPYVLTGVQIHTTTAASLNRQSFSSSVRCSARGLNVDLPHREQASLDELWDAIRMAAWSLSPSFTYYSNVAGSVVQDYLWYTPPAMTDDSHELDIMASHKNVIVNSNRISFRDKRAVPRLRLFRKAQLLLEQYSQAISRALVIAPKINITELLDLHEIEINPADKSIKKSSSLFASTNVAPNSVATSSKNTATKTVTSSVFGIHASHQVTPGSLQGFLHFMDVAASNIAHIDYESAFTELANAEKIVVNLERKIGRILAARTGTVTCPDVVDPEDIDAELGLDGAATSDKQQENILIRILKGLLFGSAYIKYDKSFLHLLFSPWGVFLSICGGLGVLLGVRMTM